MRSTQCRAHFGRPWAAVLWCAVAICVCALCVPSATADTVTLLNSDSAAARARTVLVDAARHEIDVAYFIVAEDPFARQFLDALRRAARRGVRVRMVIDGFGSVLSPQLQSRLIRAGVQLREFRQPRLLQPNSITMRLHDKYLAADRRIMIVGGRNIRGAYFGRAAVGDRNYIDLDVQISGPTVQHGWAYFDALWKCPLVSRMSPDRLLSRSPPQLMNALRLRWQPLTTPAGPVEGTLSDNEPQAQPLTISSQRIQFVFDPAVNKSARDGVTAAICRLLDSARQSVVVETPYFVPNGPVDVALRNALRRGVRVVILTNSFESTDHQVVYPAYHDVVVRYVQSGAEMWEYHGTAILHAKTVVIDQKTAAVTSFNFDPRSADLDTQTGVIVHDRRFADQVLRAAQPHFDAAVPVLRDGGTGNAGAYAQRRAAPRVSDPLGPLRLRALQVVSRAIVPHL